MEKVAMVDPMIRSSAGQPTTVTRALRTVRTLSERALVAGAKKVFPLVERVNEAYPGKALRPAWAPGPLPRRSEKTRPELGFPRETDSLCPACVREVRSAILSGERAL